MSCLINKQMKVSSFPLIIESPLPSDVLVPEHGSRKHIRGHNPHGCVLSLQV